MNNLTIHYIFFILTFLPIFCNCNNLTINEKRLETGNWIFSPDLGEGTIKFKSNLFYVEFSDEGLPKAFAQGTFRIIKNQITLNTEKIITHGHQGNNLPEDIEYIQKTFLSSTCQFNSPQEPPEYKDQLLCGKVEFWDNNSRFSSGTPRIINKSKSITLNRQITKITKTILVRTHPEHNASPVACHFDNDFNTKQGILKPNSNNYHIYIIARTLNMDKFDNSLNYWYYVQINLDDIGICMKVYGWIFGDFLKPLS